MKIKVKIAGIRYVNEVNDYWSNQDFTDLLKVFDFSDADEVSINELREMLYLAITDLEPAEAAERLLSFKLSDALSKGQIQSLSHEMIEDRIAEEYPEPELHYDLFNINQLLFKAFNGTFPNIQASIIEIEIVNGEKLTMPMSEEIMTKALSDGLTDKSILKRLYADQISGKVAFQDAAKFIWTLKNIADHKYELLTSKYWIEKEDIVRSEYESNLNFYDEDEH